MSRPLLAAALLLALAPAALLLAPDLARPFEGTSALGLSLLVVLAFASSPRGAADPGAWSAAARFFALLPPLALGFALDRAAGAPEPALVRASVAGLALLALVACAAELAARRGRAHGWHGAAWLALVPGLPLLLASMSWAGRPATEAGGASAAWHERLADAVALSPVALPFALAGEGGLLAGAEPALAAPFAGAALLLVVALAVPRGIARAGTAVLAFALLTVGARAEQRLWWVALELAGPLESVVLRPARGGETRVELGLASGERRSLEVPVPWPSEFERDALGPPSLELVGGGVVHALRSADGDGAPWTSPALSRRAPPALHEGRPRPRPSALLLAGGLAAWAVLGGGRTRGAALASGAAQLAGAAVLAFASAPAVEGAQRASVLELAGAGPSVWVESAREVASDAGPAVLHLDTVPRDAALVFTARADGASTRARWSARTVEGTAHVVAVRSGPADAGSALRAERNDLDDLVRAAWRDPSGAWHELGPWRAGAPAPTPLGSAPRAPERAPSPPLPGWLVAGLPQGVGVLVGELPPAPDGSPRWLRAAPLP